LKTADEEPERARGGPLATVAAAVVNGLTLGRLFLALAFPFAPVSWRLPMVLVGGFSDLVDGWISRLAGVHSLFGPILDPIADKTFVLTVVGALWYDGSLPTWQIPLLAFRDLAVAGASAFAVATRGWGMVAKMPPNLLGKLATAGQFVFLLLLLYDRDAAGIAFWIAAPLSLAAGLSYLHRGIARSREREQG
jgi:cardiolipin synthase